MKVAPLSGTFMIASMIGFFISTLIVYPRWPSMGFAFIILFAVMFIASMISMTYGPVEAELALDKRAYAKYKNVKPSAERKPAVKRVRKRKKKK
ncbi:MAG: hypothetical protein KJ709_07550 [Nanoarchaeota archaeon]|nr:hypothetical protein [Nanoarchaeota archaeon]